MLLQLLDQRLPLQTDGRPSNMRGMRARNFSIADLRRVPAWLRARDPRSQVERVPAALFVARTLELTRRLRQSRVLIRRSEDGRYLATVSASRRVRPVERGLAFELQARAAGRSPRQLRQSLGISRVPAQPAALPEHHEPARLQWAGFDRYRRPLWLHPGAARAWRAMQRAAARQGVHLDVISGFRGAAYQAGIFRRKLAKGQPLERILAVNAAPGFSEHHSGRALDIGTRGQPPAETSFEATAAFDWLCRNAARFGFRLSYPRDNPTGIQYEPWHWCWHPPAAGALALPRHG